VTREVGFDRGVALDAWLTPRAGAIRAAQVDLDAVWDPDTTQLRRNVERIVERIHHTGATHVFLQACPDPRGDGRFEETWFMNHQAPVKADLLSMLAAKLAHARVETWIRVPSMNLSWAWARHPDWRMPFRRDGVDRGLAPWYFRVAPDHPGARRAAIDFMADLAVYVPIRGILFDDDAYALAGEGLSGEPNAGAERKSEAIVELHREIMDAVRAWRPDCKFARNLYAPVVERAGVHPGFAQDYERSLAAYDLTVVMAYSRMEGQRRNGKRWMASLARSALRRWNESAPGAGGPPPVMFKLQTYDWSTRRWVPAKELRHLASEVRRTGIVHLGVYPVLPDDGHIPDRLLEIAPPDPGAGANRR
jgi:biofilm PGA synthesis lipoprotein PgaB